MKKEKKALKKKKRLVKETIECFEKYAPKIGYTDDDIILLRLRKDLINLINSSK